ncbi:MAG: trypsin-like serine protease, partial [Rhodospirillales bacterium]|nr:trypsin-like serine protease [Rhodospirillales bacterium]
MRYIYGLVLMLAGLILWGNSAWAQVPETQEQITLSYAPLVKQTAPAVVNIYTKTVVQERARNKLFSDPFFKQFFGDSLGLQLGEPKAKVKNSLGSGVIIDPDGTIVTNNHVIEGADQIRIVLPDRREFDATVVGADERTDLAVLHIETNGTPLPFIAFQDSDGLEVGDLVLAIGNPFGVGQTVTSGIVSALARTQVGVADVGSFIQTDAAINPGNSGGALVSMSGKLVGINTAIFSNSGGSLGIGFAVPSNMVRFVIEGLEHGGRVVRPWMGAWGQAVTSDMAEPLGFDRPMGVLINGIWQGAAADRGDIQVGDVVLQVNGRDVNDP